MYLLRFLLLLALLISGCVSAPLASRMTPDLAGIQLAKTEKVLRVGTVTGGEKTNPLDRPRIEDEGFREALINTLQRSGLFKEVTTELGGDYGLSAQIISQDDVGNYSTTVMLFVNYRLTDARSGQELWKENLLSQYKLTVSEVFVGLKRLKMCQEGAVKDNLTQLVKKLLQVVPR
jgi:hypothetical protein